MHIALYQLTNFFDFFDSIIPSLISFLGELLQPLTIYCSSLFLLSYEAVLLFKLLHPNLTLFLKVYRVILRYSALLFIPPALIMLVFLSRGNMGGLCFYGFNCILVGIYCFMASRLVIRERQSRVWPGDSLRSQWEERAGGFLARSRFFIAVSKREYSAELCTIFFSLNFCLFYWLEHEPVFAALAGIADIYGLAFFACALIANLPVRHSEGEGVGPGILRYKNGITREYIAVLKMQAIDADVQTDSKGGDKKSERIEAFMGFFCHQWYYILSHVNAFVSLNVMVGEGSYDVFLIIRKRTFLAPATTAIACISAAISQITTSTNSTLDCRLELLPQEQISSVLGKMMFDAPVPRRLEKGFLTNGLKTATGDTTFRIKDGYVTYLKIEVEKFIRSHPTQRINEPTRLDTLIGALTSEKITARYTFSIKLARIEKVELGEKDNPRQVVATKVKHGFMEIERNFEYLINSARVSAGLFVFSTEKESHVELVERARGIIFTTWETNAVCERNPFAISMRFSCNGSESLMYHALSVVLFRFCHLPRVPSGKQERRYQFELDPPPDSVATAGLLNIGKIIDPNRGNKDFLLGIEDMKRHVFINGTTGSGKSVFTRNLVEQLIDRFPAIPFLILEVKGEYATLVKQYPAVKYLEPGINFSINIFNPVVDVHVHAERAFNIIKTSFDFAELKDFSPQMEKVLVDLIIATCSDPDPAKRNFTAFFQNAQAYVNKNKGKIPFLESTWIGIENRLRRITTGPLRSVFDGHPAQDTASTLMRSRSIISLAKIIGLGGTKDDLYFVANLILEMVWGANLTRGPTMGISHVTFVDDAQYFSRTRGTTPVRETNFLEDIALLLRGTGEVLVAISTRPDISEDVLSNCGMIVCFQTRFKEDVEKLKGLLHLPEEKASILEVIPEHTSVIKLNSYASPFTVETRTPFLHELVRGGHDRGYVGVARPDNAVYRASPGNMYERAQFYANVRDYFQLKDHAWNNFPVLSRGEMENLETRISSLREQIAAILHANEEIMLLVKDARKSRPPDDHLCKIRDELLE